MTTTDHRAELEALMAYRDGELSASEAERVRAHIAACLECQTVEAELTDVSARLEAWKVEGAPSTLSAPSRAFPGSARGWLPLAAALVLTTGVSVIWLTRHDPAPAAKSTAPVESVQMAETPSLSEPVQYDAPLSAATPVRPAQRTNSTRMVAQLADGPMLARTARLTIVTDRFDASRAELDALIRKLGGFTGRILVTGTAEQGRALTATLRIPSARLDEAITGLKALGRVSSEGADGEDVTQQSIDLDARLANARNSERRLTDVLANRTGDLDDVLAVEREIARVRGEIESMEAQRKALDRRVAYATIDLQLTEEKRAAVDLGPQPLSTRFVDEFVRGWDGVLSVALELGLLAARLTPVTLVVAFLAVPWLLWRWKGRLKPAPTE